MNKFILSGALLITPTTIHGQELMSEDIIEVTARIQENIAHTLHEPCKGLEGTLLLNCRLNSPHDTSEQELSQKIKKSRSRFNLYLANSMNLPVSVQDNPESLRQNGELPTQDRPAIKIHWLPDNIQTTLNIRQVAIKYTLKF
ncbi:hypothetical protein KBD33_04685 [Candidatus Gracilibacteria bacterium]|nr:hypothetical protein [Candidatus Gracilibacteria bacterium]